MIVLPIWGVVLFLIGLLILVPLLWLYMAGAFRHNRHYNLRGVPASESHFLSAIASMSDSIITNGNATHFRTDIDIIQKSRLDLISQAQRLIQFETFKMGTGKRSGAFADALCQKALEGIQVQVLADSYGAHELPDSYWQNLKSAGVDVRFFNPFSGRSPLDYLRRNHRKLLIVDQQVALVGGVGISDLWDGHDQYPGSTPWYDFEVEWHGDVVGLLTGFFWQHWLTTGGYVDLMDHHPSLSNAPVNHPVLITPGEEPSQGDSPIRSLFQLCILSAQHRLWIASPYLLPDQATCEMLEEIRQRGVDVRILTMGPRSDKSYVYYTSRERYGSLLNLGVKVYEYQPSMMHGKVVLIDDNWVSLGSANLDPRSFFHNDELNLCVNTPHLLQSVEEFFQQGFEKSQRIRLKDWKKRPCKEKMIGQLGNFFYWQL